MDRTKSSAIVAMRTREKTLERCNYTRNSGLKAEGNGDMAKSVDATDLIVLSLGIETC